MEIFLKKGVRCSLYNLRLDKNCQISRFMSVFWFYRIHGGSDFRHFSWKSMIYMCFMKIVFIYYSVNLENHHKPNICSIMKFAKVAKHHRWTKYSFDDKNTNLSGFCVSDCLGGNYIRWFRHSFKEAFVPLGKHISIENSVRVLSELGS